MLSGANQAWAEKADRSQPLVIESDRGGSLDLQKRVLDYSGNVVLVQGSMQLRADKLEMRQAADGSRTGVAQGTPGQLATWRQKRDGSDETVEGSAVRIEFDGGADRLRLVGQAVVRRLRGATVADEISGNVIVWDNRGEIFKVEGAPERAAAAGAAPAGSGGGSANSAGSGSGRVRAVLSPRAQPASPADAAPASPPSSKLIPSKSLGDRR